MGFFDDLARSISNTAIKVNNTVASTTGINIGTAIVKNNKEMYGLDGVPDELIDSGSVNAHVVDSDLADSGYRDLHYTTTIGDAKLDYTSSVIDDSGGTRTTYESGQVTVGDNNAGYTDTTTQTREEVVKREDGVTRRQYLINNEPVSHATIATATGSSSQEDFLDSIIKPTPIGAPIQPTPEPIKDLDPTNLSGQAAKMEQFAIIGAVGVLVIGALVLAAKV